MATIAELDGHGLVRIEIEMDGENEAWRCLYGTPAFVDWLENVLPTLKTGVIGGELEPIEQVDAVFYEYVSGDHMDQDRRFKKLSWTPDHCVWEFKTLDIRIFGWVPKKDFFICAFADEKDKIELMKSYGTYIARTTFERNNLDLDKPKYVEGMEYDDVLSDAD